jgi:chromosome segregation ATPase
MGQGKLKQLWVAVQVTHHAAKARSAQQVSNAASARASAAERESRSLRSRLTSAEDDIKQLKSQLVGLEKQRSRDSNALRDADARLAERDERLDTVERQLTKVRVR